MHGTERRKLILQLLQAADAPLSAGALATRVSVSRQIVVGDVALLRAAGHQIAATPRGYVLEDSAPDGCAEQSVVCVHGSDRLAEELYIILNAGGQVLDVTVEHSVYGQICAPLRLLTTTDVDLFLEKLHNSGAHPLCNLTDGIHLHRLRAPDPDTLDRVIDALRQAGFLLQK